MAFITHVFARQLKAIWFCLLTGILLPIPLAVADGFIIRSVETRLANKVYQLNAQIDYGFSSKALEAIQNGVPVVVIIEIKVEKERNWWLNKNVAELKQGYMLLYHALSEKYIVNNLNSGVQTDYISITDALAALNKVEDLPILDAKLTHDAGRYIVMLRTYLDLESLPAPVRPLAYLSPSWRMESDWYQWPLQK